MVLCTAALPLLDNRKSNTRLSWLSVIFLGICFKSTATSSNVVLGAVSSSFWSMVWLMVCVADRLRDALVLILRFGSYKNSSAHERDVFLLPSRSTKWPDVFFYCARVQSHQDGAPRYHDGSTRPSRTCSSSGATRDANQRRGRQRKGLNTRLHPLAKHVAGFRPEFAG